MTRKPISIGWLFLVAGVLGCAGGRQQAYEGYRGLPDSQVGVLRLAVDDRDLTVEITTIDGSAMKVLNRRAVDVLPGQHTIEMTIVSATSGRINMLREPAVLREIAEGATARDQFVLDAAAGGIYAIDGSIDEDRIWIWVEDQITGDLLAGARPS